MGGALADRGPMNGHSRRPLLPRRASSTARNYLRPPAKRLRTLAMFIAIAFLQGSSFAIFSITPTLTQELFDSVVETDLAWTLNFNNIAQAIFIPLCIFLLRRRKPPPGCTPAGTGLRAVGVIGALSQTFQSLLWSAATFFPRWRFATLVLFAGACFGGVCTGCVQGSCSRLSTVWFPPGERGRATAALYGALFAGQSAAYLFSVILICSTSGVCIVLYTQARLTYPQ